MKILNLAAAASCVLCLACGGLTNSAADEYRAASPSRQNLKLSVPASSSQALSDGTGSQQSAVSGQTAVWYKATVDIASVINGGLGYVTVLCEDIISYPATSVTNDTATWGPFTPALSPDTYKFVVTKSGGSYSYELQAKPKTADDSAYVKLLYGTHTPTAPHFGSGNFTVDWNAAQTLPDKPKQVGTAAYTYSRDSSGNVTINTVFTQVKDDQTGMLMNDNYAYSQVANGGGQLDFVTYKDVHNNGQIERGAVRTRWESTGAGRADLNISGGDAGATGVTGSECWDTNFNETFYQDSLNYQPMQGDSSTCVFTSASYSNL